MTGGPVKNQGWSAEAKSQRKGCFWTLVLLNTCYHCPLSFPILPSNNLHLIHSSELLLKMTVYRSLTTFRLTGGRQKKYFSPFHFSRKKLDPFSAPGISQTQGLNLHLLHYREILFHWTIGKPQSLYCIGKEVPSGFSVTQKNFLANPVDMHKWGEQHACQVFTQFFRMGVIKASFEMSPIELLTRTDSFSWLWSDILCTKKSF